MDFTLVEEYLKVCSEDILKHDRLAENPSLYSDRFKWKIPKWVPCNANRAIALTMLISIKGFNIINETDLRNCVIRQCDLHPEDEKWNIVLELVTTEPFSSIKVLESYLKHHDSDELFGNVLPLMERINKLWKYSDIDTYREDSRGVKPVKTSEYKDKGSRRPSHVSVIQREDKIVLNRQVEIPLRRNSTNFWSNVQGLEDHVRTIREEKLIQEEREKLWRNELRHFRRRFRGKIKRQLLLLQQFGVRKRDLNLFYECLSEHNSVINLNTFVLQNLMLLQDIGDVFLEKARLPIQRQIFQTIEELQILTKEFSAQHSLKVDSVARPSFECLKLRFFASQSVSEAPGDLD